MRVLGWTFEGDEGDNGSCGEGNEEQRCNCEGNVNDDAKRKFGKLERSGNEKSE